MRNETKNPACTVERIHDLSYIGTIDASKGALVARDGEIRASRVAAFAEERQ